MPNSLLYDYAKCSSEDQKKMSTLRSKASSQISRNSDFNEIQDGARQGSPGRISSSLTSFSYLTSSSSSSSTASSTSDVVCNDEETHMKLLRETNLITEEENRLLLDGQIENEKKHERSGSQCFNNEKSTRIIEPLSPPPQEEVEQENIDPIYYENTVKGTVAPYNIYRNIFKDYWKDAQKRFGLSFAGMMLKADLDHSFNELDRKEIIEWIQKELQHNKVEIILELGAGIGRLTPFLFQFCRRLIAVDFIHEFIQYNKKLHYIRKNDQFICCDATELNYSDESVDFLFSNWLLMYLSDEEVNYFIVRCVRWIKKGGYLFYRESCERPSNPSERLWARNGNPTKYRNASFYTKLFMSISHNYSDIELEFLFSERPIKVYQEEGNGSLQVAWFLKRV